MDERGEFGRLLRARRDALDLTQGALARRVNCTVSYIEKLESGARRPSRTLARLLAETLAPTEQERERMIALARGDSGPLVGQTGLREVPVRFDLVGRDREWVALRIAWQTAAAGTPHLVVLTGEAGIGKTRLAGALLAASEQQGDVVASAHAYPSEVPIPFLPVIEWLRSKTIHASLSRLDPPWLSEIARLLPELAEAHTSRVSPDPPHESWQRARWFEALARAILGDRRPRLLVLDDLQWCDDETLDWLSYLLHFDARAPLLVVATLRREDVPTEHPLTAFFYHLRRHGMASAITLGPLNETETAALAARVVGRELDAVRAADVYRDTEGNPLFIVELARAGLAREPRADDAEGTAPSDPPLTQTLYAVIMGRLTQLGMTSRHLVDVAATAGQALDFATLAHACHVDDADLAHDLQELHQRGILRERAGERYEFGHHLIRDVAYLQLAGARGRLLHRAVAEAIITVHMDDLDHYAGQVAIHYEQAGMARRAIPYFARAAEVAHRVYANNEAINYLRRAHMLLDDSPSGGRSEQRELATGLEERLADLLELAGRHDDALAAYEEAMAHVATSERLWRARLHRKVAKVYEIQRRYAQATRAYADAERALGARSAADEAWLRAWLDVQLERMWLYFWQGLWPEIQRVAERARETVMRHGTAPQRARYFHGLTLAIYRRDRFVASKETLTYCQAHLAAIQDTKDLSQIGFARYALGYDLMLRGSFEAAEEELCGALEIARHTGDIILQARCLGYLARLSRHLGRVAQARQYVEQCLGVAEAGGMLEYIAMAHAVRAWIAWREDDPTTVKEHATTALQLWRRLPIVYSFQWAAALPLIAILLQETRVAAAIEHARLVLDPLQQRLPDALTAQLESAVHAWDAEHAEEARAHLTDALAIAERARYL